MYKSIQSTFKLLRNVLFSFQLHLTWLEIKKNEIIVQMFFALKIVVQFILFMTETVNINEHYSKWLSQDAIF